MARRVFTAWMGLRERLGFISSVTQPFCASCTRARLTADGRLRLCLLRENEVNLMDPLRNGATDEEIKRYHQRGDLVETMGPQAR